MGLLLQVLRRPRSLLIWKINFQIHLWLGLLLAAYLIVMGVSGSLLVLRIELDHISRGQRVLGENVPEAAVAVPQVVDAVRRTYPGGKILAISTPAQDRPFFVATLQRGGQQLNVRIDPQNGRVLGILRKDPTWLDFVSDLHTTLLIGRYGHVANGIGGALLLLMNITGLVIWWPGGKRWRRGLSIDFRRTWRRINYDAHRAVGFWTMAIISFWAVSGIYFGWPTQVTGWVSTISPLVSSQPPSVRVPVAQEGASPTLERLIERAHRADPGTTLAAVNFPYSRRAPYELVMRRGNGIGREYTNTVYLSPLDGRHLGTWRYGVNQSLGDWFIWLQVPLHFGTYWGLGFKLFWALLGLSVPALAITGLLLYWNRVLRHILAGRR